MRLAVTLDQLLTVGDLDGQWVILLRHAPDEFQPLADSSLFLRVSKSFSTPPPQSGDPVELQKPTDAGGRDLPAACEASHPASRRLRAKYPRAQPDRQRAAYLLDPRFHE